MPEPLSENAERTSHTDPDYVSPATLASLARAWGSLLADRYPGTQWTVTYDEPTDG